MKPSKGQIAFAYAAAAFMMLAVFHKSLGLSDTWETVFLVAQLPCWIAFFVFRRRAQAAPADAPAPSVARQKTMRVVSLVLMLLVCGSGPFWLPYTGVQLPFSTLVITSMVSCVTYTVIYFIAIRRATLRSNQAMQRTAGRSVF